jgi:hypothetical protein
MSNLVGLIAGYLGLLPCVHLDGIHLLAHLQPVRLRVQAAG